MDTDSNNQPKQALTPQQRGAMITNNGLSPIASLSDDQRKLLAENVLAQYLDDGHLRDIASNLGVARTSLYQSILKYIPEDWQAAQGARALWEMDDAETELANALDASAVLRAKERLRSAQWKLERTYRRLYGNQPDPQSHGIVNIQINLGSDGES